MEEESSTLKNVGRPLGSTQDGQRSPAKMLNLLRSKTWSWICSYYLREDGDQGPVSTYRLEKKARKEGYVIDASQWRRYRKGERGLHAKGPHKIWLETHPAFNIGPWVGDGCLPEGAFVPLWLTLTSEARSKKGIRKLKEAWKKIPREIWESWSTIENGYTNDDYVPEKKTFDSIPSMYNFLFKIASSNDFTNVFPILALAAALSCIIFDDHKKRVFFYDPFPLNDPKESDISFFHPSSRPQLIKALREVNITIKEITNVINAHRKYHGLYAYDCAEMSFDEYRNLRCWKDPLSNTFEPIYISEDDACTQSKWRNIFSTSFPEK